MFCLFWTDLVSVWMARGIPSKKIVIHSNSLGYQFGKNCRPFEQRGLSVPKKCHPFEWLGLSVWKKLSSLRTAWDIRFKKLLSVRTARAIRLKKKLSTIGGTEPICSRINFSQVSIPKPFYLYPLVSNDLLFSRSRMLWSLFTNLSWVFMDLCSFVAIFAFIL